MNSLHHHHMFLDGGYKSRKLFVVMTGMLCVTAVALLSAFYPTIQTVYPTFCTAVTGLVALYLGANSALKYSYGKNLKDGEFEKEAPKGTQSP
jgi:hypothetical protein